MLTVLFLTVVTFGLHRAWVRAGRPRGVAHAVVDAEMEVVEAEAEQASSAGELGVASRREMG